MVSLLPHANHKIEWIYNTLLHGSLQLNVYSDQCSSATNTSTVWGTCNGKLASVHVTYMVLLQCHVYIQKWCRYRPSTLVQTILCNIVTWLDTYVQRGGENRSDGLNNVRIYRYFNKVTIMNEPRYLDIGECYNTTLVNLTHLQWMRSGCSLLYGWTFLTPRRKWRRGVAWRGTPKSGQDKKWNWRTSFTSSVLN